MTSGTTRNPVCLAHHFFFLYTIPLLSSPHPALRVPRIPTKTRSRLRLPPAFPRVCGSPLLKERVRNETNPAVTMSFSLDRHVRPALPDEDLNPVFPYHSFPSLLFPPYCALLLYPCFRSSPALSGRSRVLGKQSGVPKNESGSPDHFPRSATMSSPDFSDLLTCNPVSLLVLALSHFCFLPLPPLRLTPTRSTFRREHFIILFGLYPDPFFPR